MFLSKLDIYLINTGQGIVVCDTSAVDTQLRIKKAADLNFSAFGVQISSIKYMFSGKIF